MSLWLWIGLLLCVARDAGLPNGAPGFLFISSPLHLIHGHGWLDNVLSPVPVLVGSSLTGSVDLGILVQGGFSASRGDGKQRARKEKERLGSLPGDLVNLRLPALAGSCGSESWFGPFSQTGFVDLGKGRDSTMAAYGGGTPADKIDAIVGNLATGGRYLMSLGESLRQGGVTYDAEGVPGKPTTLLGDSVSTLNRGTWLMAQGIRGSGLLSH